MRRTSFATGAPISTSSYHGGCSPAFRIGASAGQPNRLGRPLLWGVIGQRVRWRPRFMLTPNGWPPERVLPHPAEYARLGVSHDAPEFCPQFDPLLFSAEPDFSVFNSRLQWWEARHFPRVTRDD
jgi:hypothetical protein